MQRFKFLNVGLSNEEAIGGGKYKINLTESLILTLSIRLINISISTYDH